MNRVSRKTVALLYETLAIVVNTCSGRTATLPASHNTLRTSSLNSFKGRSTTSWLTPRRSRHLSICHHSHSSCVTVSVASGYMGDIRCLRRSNPDLWIMYRRFSYMSTSTYVVTAHGTAMVDLTCLPWPTFDLYLIYRSYRKLSRKQWLIIIISRLLQKLTNATAGVVHSQLTDHLAKYNLLYDVVSQLKAKFHYASWFGAGSELVRSWFELKFGLSSSLLAAN